MEEVRFGVIGAGLMGQLHATNLVSRVPGARLVGIADIDPASCASLVAAQPVEAVYEDYRRMLALAPIDAVVISTPPDLHAEMIEVAAGEKKHIFCEKPIDVDLPKVERALEAVRAAGIKLQLGFNRRFDPVFRLARDAVKRGDVGQPLRLHIVSRDPVRTDDEKPSFTLDMFLDTAIHDFDMARFVMGDEIEGVFASGEPPSGDTPHTAVTLLRFAGGAIGTIDNSWLSTYGYDQRLEIFGTRGHFFAGDGSGGAGGDTRTDEGVPFFVRRYFDSYVDELAAFVDCVRSEGDPAVTGEDGHVAVRLALAAQRSWRERRPVAVSEIG